MENFSNRLKMLRLERNLSIRQLSALTGVSPSAIHSYEIEKRNPKREVLEALCDVFNCDLDYLLGKTDVRNQTANSFGYDSLYSLYQNNALDGMKLNLQQFAENKNPTAEYDGISGKRRALIEYAMKVSEEEADRILQVMKLIVGDK
jgi:transcriptional regulator with XRE-family HTH domain